VTVVRLSRVFISYLVHPLYLTEANSSDPRTNRVAPVGQMFHVQRRRRRSFW
jgi:hypothetical protein